MTSITWPWRVGRWSRGAQSDRAPCLLHLYRRAAAAHADTSSPGEVIMRRVLTVNTLRYASTPRARKERPLRSSSSRFRRCCTLTTSARDLNAGAATAPYASRGRRLSSGGWRYAMHAAALSPLSRRSWAAQPLQVRHVSDAHGAHIRPVSAQAWMIARWGRTGHSRRVVARERVDTLVCRARIARM